jgi:hypothetical protein
VNIYDVSSFRKSSFDEFYVKAAETGSHFEPMHRNQQANEHEAVLIELKDVKIEDDKPVRRTSRKRNFAAQGGITNQTTANSSSQSQQDVEVFMIKLRPDDFRVGIKNKHIDSVSISPKGFVIAGTN